MCLYSSPISYLAARKCVILGRLQSLWIWWTLHPGGWSISGQALSRGTWCDSVKWGLWNLLPLKWWLWVGSAARWSCWWCPFSSRELVWAWAWWPVASSLLEASVGLPWSHQGWPRIVRQLSSLANTLTVYNWVADVDHRVTSVSVPRLSFTGSGPGHRCSPANPWLCSIYKADCGVQIGRRDACNDMDCWIDVAQSLTIFGSAVRRRCSCCGCIEITICSPATTDSTNPIFKFWIVDFIKALGFVQTSAATKCTPPSSFSSGHHSYCRGNSSCGPKAHQCCFSWHQEGRLHQLVCLRSCSRAGSGDLLVGAEAARADQASNWHYWPSNMLKAPFAIPIP